MKQIEVSGCKDCPFRYTFINSWEDETSYCSLIEYRSMSENAFIDFNKSGKVKSKDKITLDNCPVRTEKKIKIKFEDDDR